MQTRRPSSNRSLPAAVAAFGLLLTSCSIVKPTLHAARVTQVLPPDGRIETRTLWAEAKPLTVRVRQPSGNGRSRTVELRAVHDGGAISILAIWPDPTEPVSRRAWIWDSRSRSYFLRETETDFFALRFCIDGSPEACMMSGEEGVYDVWQWRGGWSDLVGFAEDRKLIVTRSPPAEGRYVTYPLAGTSGFVFFQWIDDAGRKPYAPIPRPTKLIDSFVEGIEPTEPTESAGDITAQGVYQNQTHMLEVARALDTGHDDDYAIDRGGVHAFSIAIGDGAEGQGHFTSGLLYLVLD